MLENRQEAGGQLASLLSRYVDHPNCLILALPRGGVAVGYPLSLALRLPLDVLITRKLGAPGNPELAMGALAETGASFLNPDVILTLGVTAQQLEEEVRYQQEEILRRQALYRPGRPLPSVAGRTVVLVDDGIATGATFFASLAAIRNLHPERLIGALPVGPREGIERARQQVDELVILEIPEPFLAVGNHYRDFHQVQDDEVVRSLLSAASALETRARSSEHSHEHTSRSFP